MTTLVKDTHKLISHLQSKGFSEDQATGFIEAVQDFDVDDFATKNDIADLKNTIKDLKIEMIKMFMVHGIAVIGLTVGLIELLA